MPIHIDSKVMARILHLSEEEARVVSLWVGEKPVEEISQITEKNLVEIENIIRLAVVSSMRARDRWMR